MNLSLVVIKPRAKVVWFLSEPPSWVISPRPRIVWFGS